MRDQSSQGSCSIQENTRQSLPIVPNTVSPCSNLLVDVPLLSDGSVHSSLSVDSLEHVIHCNFTEFANPNIGDFNRLPPTVRAFFDIYMECDVRLPDRVTSPPSQVGVDFTESTNTFDQPLQDIISPETPSLASDTDSESSSSSVSFSFIKMNNINMNPVIFDGKGFHDWFRTLEVGLGGKGLLEYIYPSNLETECRKFTKLERMTNSDLAPFARKDFKAQAYIMARITKPVAERLSECTTAYQIVTTLSQLYTMKSVISRDNLERELYQLRLRLDGDIHKYISKFETLVRRCREAGAEISLEREENIFRMGLPTEFNSVKRDYDYLDGTRNLKNFMVLKSMVIEEFLSLKQRLS